MDKTKLIRNLSRLFIQNPGLYKSMVLSKDQLGLYKYVEANMPVFSNEVATDLDISIPCASMRLRVLYKKGYLNRAVVLSDSGGVEYEYSVNISGPADRNMRFG